MHEERLLMLVYVLENLPEERKIMVGGPEGIPKEFNMEAWYSCGTSACAVGYAAMHPWFRRQGLTLEVNYGPVYKGDWGYRAAQKFFGLRLSETRYLMSAFLYKRGNRADVYRRIRKFVKDGGMPDKTNG